MTTPLGAGYQLEELSDDEAPYGWTEYVYTIHRANFGQGSSSDHGDGGQGLYRVNVVSDDTASNANTTAAYWASDAGRTRARLDRATEDFILDQLGPVIDQLDVPTSLAVGTAYEASFHLTDDITLGDDVEVRVDGAPVTVREGGTSDEGAQRSAMGLAKGTGTMTVYCPDGITSVDYYLARTGSFKGDVLGSDDGMNFTEITEYSGSKGIKELSVTLDTPYKYVQLTNTASGSLHVQGIIVMRVKGEDAIHTVRLDSSPAGVAYDLMGRKVRTEQRGVLVKGGRVVVVK